MNKLLRNPWVVAALVIGMAALWWVQMRGILQPGGASPAAPVAQVDTAPAESAPTSIDAADPGSANADGLQHDSEPPARALTATQLRWDSTPTRDPFGPLMVAAPAEIPAPLELPAADTVQVEPVQVLPALEAVLNTPSAHIAVIDGRIVRVGDKVSGRAVLRIDASSVALGAGPQSLPPLVLKLPAR